MSGSNIALANLRQQPSRQEVFVVDILQMLLEAMRFPTSYGFVCGIDEGRGTMPDEKEEARAIELGLHGLAVKAYFDLLEDYVAKAKFYLHPNRTHSTRLAEFLPRWRKVYTQESYDTNGPLVIVRLIDTIKSELLNFDNKSAPDRDINTTPKARHVPGSLFARCRFLFLLALRDWLGRLQGQAATDDSDLWRNNLLYFCDPCVGYVRPSGSYKRTMICVSFAVLTLSVASGTVLAGHILGWITPHISSAVVSSVKKAAHSVISKVTSTAVKVVRASTEHATDHAEKDTEEVQGFVSADITLRQAWVRWADLRSTLWIRLLESFRFPPEYLKGWDEGLNGPHRLSVAAQVNHLHGAQALLANYTRKFPIHMGRHYCSEVQELLMDPKWTPDGPFCSLCQASFHFFRRRHHCRQCGALVCSDCSLHDAVLPKCGLHAPVRVCDKCHNDSAAKDLTSEEKKTDDARERPQDHNGRGVNHGNFADNVDKILSLIEACKKLLCKQQDQPKQGSLYMRCRFLLLKCIEIELLETVKVDACPQAASLILADRRRPDGEEKSRHAIDEAEDNCLLSEANLDPDYHRRLKEANERLDEEERSRRPISAVPGNDKEEEEEKKGVEEKYAENKHDRIEDGTDEKASSSVLTKHQASLLHRIHTLMPYFLNPRIRMDPRSKAEIVAFKLAPIGLEHVATMLIGMMKLDEMSFYNIWLGAANEEAVHAGVAAFEDHRRRNASGGVAAVDIRI